MKAPIFALVCLCGLPLCIQGQNPVFDCGSNGSYGPLNITQSTVLQVPPDGIFHCTTVRVHFRNVFGAPEDKVLSFQKNALNTPIYILATGDVTITGTINVSGTYTGTAVAGLGGAGGFDGGFGNATNGFGGDGQGPGGGKGARSGQGVGHGSYKVTGAGTNSGAIYGTRLLIPLVGGSGAGGSSLGGGGGGGAICIASNTRINFEYSPGYPESTSVRANGGSDSSLLDINPAGSGGAIRIVAPRVEGIAAFSVRNRFRQNYSSTSGSGFIRIDTWDSAALTIRQGPDNDYFLDQPDAIGSAMVVFPTPMSKLSIANAAGTAVAENASGPVSVILPTGTNPNQTIQVRARNFGSVVSIRVRLVPESGDAMTYDATIDNTINNPATTNVPVILPINTGVRIEAFTR